jgi:predicted transposase YdaD
VHEYDTVLKALLQSPQNTIFEKITNAKIDHWLNVEFPQVQQTRVDMLGVAQNGQLIGLELQSTNDMNLPLRMAEYALRTYRLYGEFPDQYVLYVGEAEMRMPSELAGPRFACRYQILDIRSIDEEALLNSPFAGDNILAILTNNRDRRETIQRILRRIATLETDRRDDAFQKLTILAGLRKLGDAIRAEVKHMPILDDIMDHDLLGPAIRQGMQKGLELGLKQGVEKGLEQGVQRGELTILRRQLAKRFGALPATMDERLSTLSTAQLEDLSVRLFDVKSIDELFAG